MNLYNVSMIEITPMQPEEVSEVRRVIYTTAHSLFEDRHTLEETIAYYQINWPLKDLDDYQQAYVENGGVFLVLRDGGRIIGTGALRRLEDGVGEIKRLWLLKEYQRKGLGYQMMVRLMDAAREKGYKKLRLETNGTYQSRAIEFYRQLGFYDIPRYGDDPDDVAMELTLE